MCPRQQAHFTGDRSYLVRIAPVGTDPLGEHTLAEIDLLDVLNDIRDDTLLFRKTFGKGFESYFLAFSSGPRLEIMTMDSVCVSSGEPGASFLGLAHLAISVGTSERVDRVTARLEDDGYAVLDGPRTTGDGFYESVVLDPEGNRIELTV